jgi:hypothetical protein
MANLNWEVSNLTPPAFYQLRLGTGDKLGMSKLSIVIVPVIDRSVNDARNYYSVRVGQWDDAQFEDLKSAKEWGIEKAKTLLIEMLGELQKMTLEQLELPDQASII